MTREEIAEWRANARAWVMAHVPPGTSFSGNDLWKRGLPAPPNRRLLGSVLLGLEADGYLSRQGQTVSEGGHGQSINVWHRN